LRLLIVIDEAQNLPVESLEELRLLSNLETEDRKLLQILLAGQPLLREKLASDSLAQLAQRISIWEETNPLGREEIEAYVNYRVIKAGGPPLPMDTRAWDVLYESSSGLPRLINKIMDRTLLLAAAQKERRISATLVLEATETFGPRTQKGSLWQKILGYLPLHYLDQPLLWVRFG
jgi:general secretion pathway protein A